MFNVMCAIKISSRHVIEYKKFLNNFYNIKQV